MFLRFEDNSNIEFCEDRVFQERSEPRVVLQVLRRRSGKDIWCGVRGMYGEGDFRPAQVRKVDDSGDGTCYLVYGGPWGLRLNDGATEWGEPFLLMPVNDEDLRYA